MTDYRQKAIIILEMPLNKNYVDGYCVDGTTKKDLYDSTCAYAWAYHNIGLFTIGETIDYIKRLSNFLFE